MRFTTVMRLSASNSFESGLATENVGRLIQKLNLDNFINCMIEFLSIFKQGECASNLLDFDGFKSISLRICFTSILSASILLTSNSSASPISFKSVRFKLLSKLFLFFENQLFLTNVLFCSKNRVAIRRF